MEENKYNCGIYVIENKLSHRKIKNLLVYVGSSVNLKNRRYEHFRYLKNNNHHCNHLQSAYNKIKRKYSYNDNDMEEVFVFRPIVYIEKIEDKIKLKGKLLKHENIELDRYKKEDGSIDHSVCYNMYPIAGSCLGIKRTEEQNKRNSESHKGRPSPMEGKKHTKESIKKISDAGKDRKHTEESKKKIIESRKWYRHTEESKKKMSCSKKGKGCIRVINITTHKEFDSIKEASEFYGMGASHIGRVCRGERKSAGGFKWCYLNNP